jgi:hypothetical protein
VQLILQRDASFTRTKVNTGASGAASAAARALAAGARRDASRPVMVPPERKADAIGIRPAIRRAS